jgi:hypothetical protein
MIWLYMGALSLLEKKNSFMEVRRLSVYREYTQIGTVFN